MVERGPLRTKVGDNSGLCIGKTITNVHLVGQRYTSRHGSGADREAAV